MVPDLAESYARARNWSIDPRTVAGLKARIQRWRRWRQRKYLQKTRRSCTAFIVMKKPHRFMACDRDWYSPTWQSLLDNPDALIEKGTILKAGNTATVAQVEVDSQPYVIKRYNIKNNRHALRRCLRPTRAMLSWENAHRLAFLGIDTPQPLAVIEERWWGLRRKAYFIMAHLQGATIDRVLPAVAQDQQTLNGHLDQLTRLLKQLVMAQLSHGDFKATNFILSSGRLYLVDLDGMRAHRSRSAFQQAFHRDLQRLHRNWRNFPEIYRPLADRTARLMAASARE
jgi:tRNA A-37 threonylcarbamoyl transferase component Bud32